MIYFNINFNDLNSSIISYKKNKNMFIEDIKNIYSSLNNVDSGWNDSNSSSYIESLKVDKFKINNYFEELDKLYDQIENFKNNIQNISSKYFCKCNFQKIKYDDNKIDLCIDKLNQIYGYIANAQNYINRCSFDSDFKARYQFNVLKSSVNNMKKDSNDIINKLNSLKKSVNNLVYDNKISIKKVSDIELDIKPLKYEWKVIEPNLKE